jgi:hypothetical protein
MQDTKLNRAQRRAAQSKRPANYCKNRLVKKNDGRGIALGSNVIIKTAPQIAAPSRATRFEGMT